jgi:HlyD family secretion protein
LALLMLVVAGSGCGQGQAATSTTAAHEFAVVERRDLEVRAEASGQIEPIRTVEVKSKASGEILALPVETGDVVRRGALLAEIDPRDVKNALEQAQADSAVAEARYQTSRAQRIRTDTLLRANVVTEQEAETARLDEANSRAQLVKAYTSVQLAQERMKDVTIRAPIDGVIISRTVEIGTIIASASQNVSGGTTLMTMADLSTMQVRALIDETDLGKIVPEMPVEVSVEAYPERTFHGQVLKIEPQAVIDQNVTMFPVLVQLDNRENLLKVGMNADVQIKVAERPNVLVVPNSAVVSPSDAAVAGSVFGLSEEQVRDALSNHAPSPETAEGQPGDSAGGQRTGASSSEECTALMQKAREAGGFNNLSEAERAKMRECRPQGVRGQSGQRGGRNGGPGGGNRGPVGTTPGVVFVAKDDGTFAPRSVTLGVNDWEYTEVLRGLDEGERVVIVSVARLQAAQQDFLNRMRERSQGSVIPGSQPMGPGMGPGGGRPGGGGGGNQGGGGRGNR